ncbi:hypothetical protein [Mucilaginibacter pocheonensis]|uniref:Uncharacterized protein n=1 Tax=Mucilaginibacter pocheonensis TaxID=398050 RepID=A0ABU1TI26_9SPHI|nr:hypothetical protein [Mucilaginibacter pocheonensis]MDR6945057.1 hypothetical protein [Mucilaginibacter pocheonensis]
MNNNATPFKNLSRQELIIIVQKLLDTEGSFDDEQEQWRALEANFVNWTMVLKDIYETQLKLNPTTLTAEEIVDRGLARKPIELPERMPRNNE